jgi:hypothetical protein
VAKHDCDGRPAKSGSRENADTEVVLPKKENGTDLHQCRSRPRILRVLAVLPRLFSAAGWSTYLRWCPRPRDAKVSPIFYPNRLPASIRFRVPWTWAIPNELGSAIASQFRMPSTGGQSQTRFLSKIGAHAPCSRTRHKLEPSVCGRNPKSDHSQLAHVVVRLSLKHSGRLRTVVRLPAIVSHDGGRGVHLRYDSS